MTQQYFKKTLAGIVKSLKAYEPEKIILYGSYARGTPSKYSDIDLFIIKATNDKPSVRIGKVLRLVDWRIPIEPLVYTPKELRRRQRVGDFFIEEVLREGKVIYEKGAS